MKVAVDDETVFERVDGKECEMNLSGLLIGTASSKKGFKGT